MIDYLFRFPNQEAAKLVMSPWVDPLSGDWQAARFGSGVLPVKPVVSDEVVDEDGTVLAPRVELAGYWLIIALMTIDNAMYALPSCVQESQRPTSPTVVSQTVIRTKLLAEDYASFLRIEPVFCGAAYKWRDLTAEEQEAIDDLLASSMLTDGEENPLVNDNDELLTLSQKAK